MFRQLLLLFLCFSANDAQFYGYGYPVYYTAPVYYPPVAPAYYPTYYPVQPYYHNPIRSMLRGAMVGASLGFWGKKK